MGAYARLYGVLNRVPSTDMTVTLAGEGYPRKLMNYVKETYGYEVGEERPGIYRIRGDIYAVQVLEMKRLRDEDGGEWLRNLRGGLKGAELRGIIEKVRGMPRGTPAWAYMSMVLQANSSGLKEMLAMSDSVVALDEVLEEYGLTAKWEARGLERGREKGLEEGLERGLEEGLESAVRKLQKHGMDPTEIAEALELPLSTVFRYLKTE